MTSRCDSSRDAGRTPSRCSSGTRSSHLPTSARSRAAAGCGAASSTDEHAGRGVADRAAPDGGSVGDQPDLAQQVGGGASSGHIRSCPREPGVLGRTARTGSRRRACGLSAYRLTVMPTEPTPRRPSTGASAARPMAGPDARRSSVTPVRLGAATVLVIAALVAGFGLLGGSGRTPSEVAAAATSALTGSPSATLAVTAAGSASPGASATEAPATERATPDPRPSPPPSRPPIHRRRRPRPHRPRPPRNPPATAARPPSPATRPSSDGSTPGE